MSHIPKNQEPSKSAPPPDNPGQVGRAAMQPGRTYPKRRRGLSVLEKYQICKKRCESKENEAMKLEEFAHYFPGIIRA